MAGVAYSGVNLKCVYSEGARTIALNSCAFRPLRLDTLFISPAIHRQSHLLT